MEAGRLEALVARPDEDLMASSVAATVITPGAAAFAVAPMPYILSDDSSESEGNASAADSASAHSSEEVASGKVSHSAMAQHLEESEAESDERPPLVQP